MNNWGGITQHMFVKPRTGTFKHLRKYFSDQKKKKKVGVVKNLKINPISTKHSRESQFYRLKLFSILMFLGVFTFSFVIDRIFVNPPPSSEPQLIFLSADDKALSLQEVSKMHEKSINLRRNYNSLIKKGEQAFENGKFKTAALHFFNAKTIFPYETAARLKLIETFETACTLKRQYCGNAKKEIKAYLEIIK